MAADGEIDTLNFPEGIGDACGEFWRGVESEAMVGGVCEDKVGLNDRRGILLSNSRYLRRINLDCGGMVIMASGLWPWLCGDRSAERRGAFGVTWLLEYSSTRRSKPDS